MNFPGRFDPKASDVSTVSLDSEHFTFAPNASAASQHDIGSGVVVIPDAHLLFSGDYKRAGNDLVLSSADQKYVVHDYFKTEKRPTLVSQDGATLSGHVVSALTGHAQYAQASAPASGQVIGQVMKLSGSASAIRNGVAVELNIGDSVQKGDVIQTGSDSSIGLTLADGTVFGMTSNARMVLNEMIYDPNGSSNSSLVSLVQGTITFVAGQTAKNGNMRVDTPVATMGIRGTAVLVEISANDGPTKFSVLLEPDGKTGSFNLYDKVTGQLLGTVSQAGQVTFVSPTGLNQPATAIEQQKTLADLQAEKALIQQVFQLYFPNYNPDDSKPNSTKTGPRTDIGVPENVIGKYAINPDTGRATITYTVPVTNPDTHQTTNVSIVYINTPPSFSVTNAFDVQSSALAQNQFKLGDHVTITDPDIGVAPFYDVAIYYRPNSGNLIQANGPASTPGAYLIDNSLISLDPVTGVVTYHPDAFLFLGDGETAIYKFTFIAASGVGGTGSDAALQTLYLTVTGENETAKFDVSNTSQVFLENLPLVTTSHDFTIPLAFTDEDFSDKTFTVSKVFLDAASSDHAANFHGNAESYLQLGIATKTALGTPYAASFTGAHGILNAQFSAVDTDFDYLAENEKLILKYTISISDGHSASNTQTVTITITGTNDAPVIVVEDLSGAVTEMSTPSGNLINSGIITFTDVDLTDVHLVSPNGVAVGTNLGTLTAVKNTDTTGTGTGGQLTWTYSVNAALVEYLGDGDSRIESFTITLDDQNGSTITRQIDVTITGTNDAPVIVVEDLSGAVTEMSTPSGNLINSGIITFTDVDLTDVHLVSPNGVAVGTNLGTLTAVKNTDTTGTGTGGQLTWTYSVNAALVEYLGDGDSRIESFTITLDDQNGSTITRQIDVTITGTNDAPVIVVEDLSGAVTEMSTPSGNLINSGIITFTDVDLTDVHLVSPNGVAVGTNLGTLTAVKNTDTTGTGTGGQLTWTYSVNAALVEYLGDGDSRIESFTITLDDQNGSTITRQIDVTITGTNDAPVIVVEDLSGAVTEMSTPSGNLINSGIITFTDVDLTDVHLVSPNGVAVGTNLGTLTAVKNTDTTGTGTGGQLTWTYSVNAALVEYLGDGDSRIESFTITLDDQNGSTITRQIDVTITGTNDAPVIVVEDLSGAVTEMSTPSGNLINSGIITFTDVDLTDVHLVSPNGVAVGTNLGTLTAVKNTDTTGTGTGGQLTWTYSVNAALVEYLGDGDSRIESFTITLDDQNGSTITRQIDVTITGTNDAPVIVVEDLSGAVTEMSTPSGNLINSGIITFTDVDLTDVHLVSPNGVAVGTNLGTLTAVKNTDTTGTGTGGQLTWTYSVNAALVEYLGDGDSRIESFTITLDDQNGSTITRQIDVTITGTNDAPVIVVEDLSGAVTEMSTPSGNLINSGIITFTDVDLTDVHLVSPNGVAVGTNLGTLTAVKNTDTTGTGTGGQLTWTYSVNAALVEYLGDGDSRIESFTITLDDQNGSTITRQIDVTITGTNDAPVIVVEDLSGAVTEMSTPSGNLINSGIITFTDVDLTDVHLVSPNGVAVGTNLGTLTAVKNTDTTGTGTGGQLTWTYSVNAALVEYLGDGDSRIESFTITLDDQNGSTITRQIDVTITGTNDAPVIVVEDLSGAVTEMSTPSGNLINSGIITFTDVDLTDVHLVSPNGVAVGTNLGTLTAVKNTDTTGTGTGGQLTWTYSVNAALVEYLGDGDSRIESFTITLDDQNGSTITRQIDVTITGTNDAPVIVVEDLSGAVTEMSTPSGNLINSGIITFTDVDLTDVHLVSPNGVAVGTNLGTLTAVKNTDTTGTGTGGQLTWTYSVNAALVEYLGDGDSRIESFTITLDDQNGSTITRQIDVTITGTNDAPVIVVEDLSGAVTEMSTPSGNLINSGIITFTDVDLTDVHLVSPNGVAVGTNLGTLTAVKNTDTTGTGTGGQLTWTYSVNAALVEYLGDGDSRIESFTITLDDQNGSTITRQIDVTITGTNDAPVIVVEDLSGAVTEMSTPSGNLINSGIITFTDVDLTDVHLVSPNGVAVGTNLGTLTAVKNTDTTGTGTGGQLTWTYSVNAVLVEYLGDGDSRIESFTITLDDQNGSTITRQIDVTITGTNDAPVAVNNANGNAYEASGTNNNIAGQSASGNVLTNDTDVDAGDTKTVTAISFGVTGGTVGSDLAGAWGTLRLNADGTYTYTVDETAVAPADGNGDTRTDVFTYTMRDAAGLTSSATLGMIVHGRNDNPNLDLDNLAAGTGVALTYNTNATPIAIATNVGITDVDSPTFGTGALTVSLGLTADPGDQFTIAHQGNGAGQIGVSGNTIRYANVVIGTFSGGQNGDDLVIDFSGSAVTHAATEALVEQIRFAADSAGDRTATFTLNDGYFGPGLGVSVATITVTGPATFTGTSGIDTADADNGTLTGFTGGTIVQLQDAIGDTFTGGSGNDTIVAGAGDDTINGGGDNDTVSAGGGNDMIIGGAGTDNLTGGSGADTFKFNQTSESVSSSVADTITDFVSGTDKIDLSAIDTALTAGTTDAFIFVVNATPSTDPGVVANSLTWYQDTANQQTVIQADNTGDTTPDIVIKLAGLHTLAANDFIL